MTLPVTIEANEPITFYPETSTYRLHHDWREDESITTTITKGVAAVTNTPPTDMDPLFERIDPDALDQLYGSTEGGVSRDDGWTTFRFNGCVVTVYATGTVEIQPAGDGNPIPAPVPRTLRDR